MDGTVSEGFNQRKVDKKLKTIFIIFYLLHEWRVHMQICYIVYLSVYLNSFIVHFFPKHIKGVGEIEYGT